MSRGTSSGQVMVLAPKPWTSMSRFGHGPRTRFNLFSCSTCAMHMSNGSYRLLDLGSGYSYGTSSLLYATVGERSPVLPVKGSSGLAPTRHLAPKALLDNKRA